MAYRYFNGEPIVRQFPEMFIEVGIGEGLELGYSRDAQIVGKVANGQFAGATPVRPAS